MPTKISWVINPDGTPGEVWNWETGCDPFTEGCEHCYAKRGSCRLTGRCGYPAGNPFKPTYHPDKIDLPIRWKKRRTIFSCSMGDWMHDDVTTEQIDSFLEVVDACQRHTVLTLTKRTGNLINKLFLIDRYCRERYLRPGYSVYYPPNLYLGATIELQKYLHRLDELLSVSACGYFLSLEPLLGPITIPPELLKRLAVVIVGGENGPGARPMRPDWVRSIKDQCNAAGVMFFFKGWGEYVWRPTLGDSTGRKKYYFPDGVWVEKVGSKESGHMLDGVFYRQVPWGGSR